MPGTRRSTDTTTVVSSRTLPIAGIDFLAAFRDDPLQFSAFRFRQDAGTPFNRGKTFRPAGLAEPVDVIGRLFQLGGWQSLQIFHNDFQSAHAGKLNAFGVSNKPVSLVPKPFSAVEPPLAKHHSSVAAAVDRALSEVEECLRTDRHLFRLLTWFDLA